MVKGGKQRKPSGETKRGAGVRGWGEIWKGLRKEKNFQKHTHHREAVFLAQRENCER